MLDDWYGRPIGFHEGFEVGMGMARMGTDYHTLTSTQTHHSWVWVVNLFTQSKTVNYIVIILSIIDTHTTT